MAGMAWTLLAGCTLNMVLGGSSWERGSMQASAAEKGGYIRSGVVEGG